MCRGRGSRKLTSVDTELTTICMELRLDGEMPTGHATDDDGHVKHFAGWLGLVAAIEELLSGEKEQAGGD
jgi:hypothetical protein